MLLFVYDVCVSVASVPTHDHLLNFAILDFDIGVLVERGKNPNVRIYRNGTMLHWRCRNRFIKIKSS